MLLIILTEATSRWLIVFVQLFFHMPEAPALHCDFKACFPQASQLL